MADVDSPRTPRPKAKKKKHRNRLGQSVDDRSERTRSVGNANAGTGFTQVHDLKIKYHWTSFNFIQSYFILVCEAIPFRSRVRSWGHFQKEKGKESMTSSQKTAVLTVARRDVGIKTRKQIELPAEQSVKNLMTHAQ